MFIESTPRSKFDTSAVLHMHWLRMYADLTLFHHRPVFTSATTEAHSSNGCENFLEIYRLWSAAAWLAIPKPSTH